MIDGSQTAAATDLGAAVRGVRALVLDADGVLMLASCPLPGSAEALEMLEAAGIPYRVVTNYSSAHRTTVAAGVSRKFGRPVRPELIITAASAAAAHTAIHHPGQPLLVLGSPDALREWEGQRLVGPDEADAPDRRVAAVVIGDAGDDLSFRNLDIAFRQVRAGAAFIAMHKNPWWVTPRGVTLDAGALVVGLEHALGRRAVVTGKPSPVVFREAVRELVAEVRAAGGSPLRRSEIAMVGDDLRSDIAGARRAGLRGILVLTGKTDRPSLDAAAAGGRLRGSGRPNGIGANLLEVVTALLGGAMGPR
ncbi:MAG TPA: HAD-IIA family hydrolase [Candidatus Sulfomarinibacteraceae bacterium]|nr:HAD-IIA family hydrolase [Candidatus Sulfomarinibacteraceae bacterium]